MSVIQVEDLVSYQLRTNFLNTIKDGVGERLITINDGFLNTSGFKSAGWRSNPAYIKRVHSPPIPTAIASEYFQAPKVTGSGIGLEDEAEEGGMITGYGISGETHGPGAATKKRRRRERIEEEDSSDLSDDSDDDDGEQRAAQQIKFAKMPVRTRSGSSPARGSNTKDMTSPSRPINVRRGSQSAIEAVKERSRRDTVTSSEFSSENELDNSVGRRAKAFGKGAVKATKVLVKHTSDPNLVVKRQHSDLLEEEEDDDDDDDSDGSDASSAFAESIDSASILESIDNPMATSPIAAVGAIPRQLSRATPRKTKPPPPALEALPPPRPISMIQPKSLLSAAINAKKTKAAMPFESFASLSGKGDPNPLRIRIWVPFTTSSKPHFEVLMRRTVHDSGSGERQVTVADLIGLSLWRYHEENLEPPIPPEKLNVNKWVLRLIDDDEVDYDFPALERTQTVVQFTTVNNARGRVRAGVKNFDEFGLVEATDAQFHENEKTTPQFKQEAVSGEAGNDDLTSKDNHPVQQATVPEMGPRLNPVLVTRIAFNSSTTLADAPNTPLVQSATRSGIAKRLRVRVESTDDMPGQQMVTVDVTTDTYLEEVLDVVCKKQGLVKANHLLRIPNAGTVVLLDRTVGSIGNITDLECARRRFGTDAPLTTSSSPLPTQFGGFSPRTATLGDVLSRKAKKTQIISSHPLRETMKQDEIGNSNSKRWIVLRKQRLGLTIDERLIVLDGEYLHITPAGKSIFEVGQGKSATVHFSSVVGCSLSRKHNTTIKLFIFRPEGQKRYDFEAKTAAEAQEIASEIVNAYAPYSAKDRTPNL